MAPRFENPSPVCAHVSIAHRRWFSSSSPGQGSAKVVRRSSEKHKRRITEEFMVRISACVEKAVEKEGVSRVCLEFL
jgi:hypothetical protein